MFGSCVEDLLDCNPSATLFPAGTSRTSLPCRLYFGALLFSASQTRGWCLDCKWRGPKSLLLSFAIPFPAWALASLTIKQKSLKNSLASYSPSRGLFQDPACGGARRAPCKGAQLVFFSLKLLKRQTGAGCVSNPTVKVKEAYGLVRAAGCRGSGGGAGRFPLILAGVSFDMNWEPSQGHCS